MIKSNTKKVCIVVSSLGGGGAERSSATLSEILFDLGYEIHIISVLDIIDYPYKGKLLNLGKLKNKNDSTLGRIHRLRVFRNYIKNNNFDYIIDNRTRGGFFKELIISRGIYNPKNVIYCVRSYNTELYIHSNRFLGKLLYNSSYKIVTVSSAIRNKLSKEYNFKNLKVIHNPVDLNLKKIEASESKEKYILFFGRLDDEVKNISLLLEAYSKSILPESNIKLKVLGDGEDRDKLTNKAKKLQIDQKIEFLGFKPNPYNIVKAAKFTVLTSKYEGFPRVLIESLALGVPVVSVNCMSGPDEIIVDAKNGLLVENYNVKVLASALNRMINDKELYLNCKSNAETSVNKFSKENIGLQWQNILK